ncbi:hypothetical protein F4801DRAFT_594171 [Xylaria longipes]|nr:hypothetical protein F4801DRAFT_594171 [Xylaria longipes]
MSSQFHAPVPLTKLYFAYGDNLWLEQMAKRCPDSVYIGRAVLQDHYWHINRRGVAMIAPRSGFTVHGLVYEITDHDETRLDRSGHVHGAYSKAYKRVNLYEASEALQMNTRWMVKDGGPKKVIKIAQHLSTPTSEWREYGTADVIVYFSESFVRYGQARDDYIDQMNCGIRDAISLGVPAAYFKHAVRTWIPKRETLHNSSQRWNRHTPANSYPLVLSTTRPFRSMDTLTAADRRKKPINAM